MKVGISNMMEGRNCHRSRDLAPVLAAKDNDVVVIGFGVIACGFGEWINHRMETEIRRGGTLTTFERVNRPMGLTLDAIGTSRSRRSASIIFLYDEGAHAMIGFFFRYLFSIPKLNREPEQQELAQLFIDYADGRKHWQALFDF
jgi:hypothetical protein